MDEEYSGINGKIESAPSPQTRMHTAEHVFFRSLQKQIPEAKLEKIDLSADESSFFVIAPEIKIENILEAEKLANKIIKEDRPVKEYFVKRTDLDALKELRIRIERIKEDTVRVIEVSDFDKSACSGDHVSHTSLIKGILVTRFNALGKNRYEVRFKVDYQDELFEFARIARQVKQAAGTDYPLLVNFIGNLKEENARMKEKVRELSAQISVDIKKEKIKNINLHYASFPGINKKQFIEKINSIDDKSFVACFINEEESKAIAIRTDCLDANELLKKLLSQIAGKGGGNKLLAQGSVDADSEKVFAALKKIL